MNVSEKQKLQFVSDTPKPLVRRERPEMSASLGAVVCCAGYGKTSYLAQLNKDCENSVLLSFKRYDNSPERVVSLIEAAIKSPSDLTGDYDKVFHFTKEMSSKEGGLVLIDNADVITDKEASSLLTVICDAALEGGFRLLLAGRSIPPFLIDYLMNGSACLYGIREMSLTRSETEEYLKLINKSYDEKYVNALYSFTLGWCAGVAEIAKNADADGEIPLCINKTYLEKYIEYNILSDLGGDLAEYLKLTAFLDAKSGDFASTVFGINDGKTREERLVSNGVLLKDESGRTELPEVMRAVLSNTLEYDRKRKITERASQYYIKEKCFAEAVKLFDVSGNAAAAERMLKNYGEKFLSNYEFELVGYCGDIIEKNGGTTDPEVLGILAQYYYYCGELSKMEAAFNMADSMFGKENRYSVSRKLYNGLIRFNKNKKLYTENVKSACEYFEANAIPLPFLNKQELDTLSLILNGSDDSGKLRIYRFGTLRLYVGENEIQCKSRRSLELVAYMLENEGKPIERETLLNMLWKDDIPTNAVAMLHNLIYGLRKELGAYGLENIIIYKNKCYLLDMSMLVEDDREILEVCEAVENSDKKKLALHAGVLEKYWGRYLGGADSRDSQDMREYYDRCFVKASLMAAEICREKKDFERELLFLKNASDTDPYSEQIICNYIKCCFAYGKPDKAKKKYDDYSKMIDDELGIEPSLWLRKEFLSGFSNEA